MKYRKKPRNHHRKAAMSDAKNTPKTQEFDAEEIFSDEGYYLKYGDVTIRLVEIDEATADDWLTRFNTHNRELSSARTAVLVRDVEEGNWPFTGSTICFSGHGDQRVLLDGQHRLEMIRLSKISVTFLVVEGLDPAVQDVIDTGKPRTFGDLLALEGWINPKRVSTVARRVLLFRRGTLPHGGRTQLSTTELKHFVYSDRAAVERAARMSVRLVNLKFSGPAGAIAAMYYLCAEKDQEAADLFFGEHLGEGLNVGHSHPAKALTRRFVNAGPDGMTQNEAFLLSGLAWNKWRKNEKVERLQAPRAGWPTDMTEFPIF